MTATASPRGTRLHLLELTSGMFTMILALRRSRDLGQEEALRQRVTARFANLEREGFEAGFTREDMDKVRFALVAFLDETILDSDWAHREYWRDRPLQLDLFGERRAGSRFFEELQDMRGRGEARREVVEVYGQCLALGFEGQFRVSGLDRLTGLKADLARELGINPLDRRELKLSPHGKRRDSAAALDEDTFPFWRLTGAVTSVILILFLIYYVWVNHDAGQALQSLPAPL